MKTFGYIRVSSDKQTVENQRFEISEFCKAHNIEINGWIEETISGTKPYDKRALGRLLRRVDPGDLIVCSELSRLGRNLYMIMEILSVCMKRHCSVWTIKDRYRLGDDIESKVLAFAFGLSAEIERQLISQRTKEALARRRAEGKTLGRPRHSATTFKRLCDNHDNIVAWIDSGVSKTRIASRLQCSRSLLYSYLKGL